MHFENSCRLCLKDLSDVLFDEDSHVSMAEDKSLQRMVLECFQIQVSDDESVTKVCDKCHYETNLVSKIRKRVRKTDFQVKQYYASVMMEEKLEVKEESPGDDQEDLHVDRFQSDNEEYETKHETLANLEILPADDVEHVERCELIEATPLLEHEETSESDFVLESEHTPVKRKRVRTQKRKGPKIDSNTVIRRKIDHRCYICPLDFENIEMLDSHLGTHVGSTSPICNLCDFHATTVRFLNMHLRTIHFRKGKRIPCEECKNNNTIREFSSKEKLQAHIKSVHEGIVEVPERKFVCTYCGKAYSRATGLRMHENIHTKAILHKCQQCPFAATSRSGLLRHLRIHTAEKPFKCDKCDASFNQSNGLHSHKASRHNNERPFSCEICGERKRFKSKYSLQNHMRLHEKSQNVAIPKYCESGSIIKTFGAEIPVYEPELKCSFCPAVYRKELFLCRHIIEKHPSEKVEMIPCDTCNAANKNVFFLTQNEKDRHVDNHEKIKPIPDKERVCIDCGEIFQTTASYKRHRQKHVKNICKECGKSFATSQTLRLHLVTVHLKSRPYKCDKCELSFGQMTTLNAHMKVHQK
ncbi:zinc finger protein 678-like isoform X1 [Armigeres subalbatus]|uniref:zinc finger protein 678-like isoform X1 n=1 Tax=Armigeres subalbatus TaxID=124917 RepID=UPI002ED02607